MSQRGAVNIKIIGGIVLAMLLIAAGCVYFFIVKPKSAPARKKEKAVDWEKEYSIINVEGFSDMTISPAGSGGYFVVTLAFEIPLKAKGLPEEIEAKKAMLSQSVYQVLSSYPLEELVTPERQTAIKERLKNVINTHLDKGKLNSVIFERYVSQ